jgi:hypothetical protein
MGIGRSGWRIKTTSGGSGGKWLVGEDTVVAEMISTYGVV